LTLHNNEGNYLAHTQGKRHENNLAKHAAREAKDAPAQPQPNERKVNPRKAAVKIGQPGYHVTKQYDQESRQRSLLFQMVQPWDKQYQYLLFAAEPYESLLSRFQAQRLTK